MNELLISAKGGSDLGIAIVVSPDQTIGFLANTVATISSGLGALHPSIGRDVLEDKNGFKFNNSADRPVPILQADHASIHDLILAMTSLPEGAHLVVFPAFARKLHSYPDYQEVLSEKDLLEEPIDGLGLIGPKKWVKSKTGSLKLLR